MASKALEDVFPDPGPLEEPHPATPTTRSIELSRTIMTRFIAG